MSEILNYFMPDFVGIGAMRSGTTWFSKNLAKHPEIAMAKKKELHFFDQQIAHRRIPFLQQEQEAKLRYCKNFVKASFLNKVKGEFTPAYAILPVERISLINKWMPNLKLIYSMRDPVMRAWSHARKDYEIYNGKPIEQASTDELIKYFQVSAVAQRGNYAQCLENWFRFYPQEVFFITFMDDITSRPLELLKDVCKFLGVDQNAEFDQSEVSIKVNARPVSDLPDDIKNYLENTLYQQNSRLESLINCKLPW